MSTTLLTVGLVLKAYNQMTGGLQSAGAAIEGLRGKIDKLRENSEKLGRGALASGFVAGGTLMKTVSAFAELEDASTRLKVTMMGATGAVSDKFESINTLAVKLGDELPGTSADFLNMMATLKQFGISDESILSGVGDAAARIGVLLKMAPEGAAEFVSKMKEATGTADKDMLDLMDTIQRVFSLGVKSDQMMYAFARSGGALKTFGIQGLQASKDLAPIFAMLIGGGLSGETIGTGFAAILNSLADRKKMNGVNAGLARMGINLELFDKKGKFSGPEALVEQFDKLKKLNPQQLNAVLKAITGGGQDQQMLASIVTNGLEGYKDMQRRMQEQADLQKRVNAQLSTLKNLWDAATGTFTNALAAFAESFAPELKSITEWFGKLSENIGKFSKEHPMLSKFIGIAVGGFALVTIGLGAMAIAFAGILKYIALIGGLSAAITKLGVIVTFVSRLFMLNPIGLAVTAMIGLAALLIANWAPVKTWFTGFFSWVGDKARMLGSLIPNWVKAPSLAPSVASATAGRNGGDFGGTLNIKLDGPAHVASVKSNDPRFGFNVDAGMTMAGSY